ncbi:MAG TPA: hypothetical protein VLT33_31915, partial [Labilithrix sp.]|nr:hypothetical protein [Labilithrix sp.]
IDEPVIGVVYDGSGWGPDGTSWGAEILLVDGGRWRRVNTFRPLPLPGGELAIRDVWRVALAVLCEAFGREEGLALTSRLAVFERQPPATLATVAAMVETRTSTVEARGMGRWFDAIGALALSLPRAGFDGHVAIALEEAAEAGEAPSYPVGLPTAIALEAAIGPAHEVDLRPTVRAVATDLLAGVSPGRIAARFHGTVVEATSAVVARVIAATGLRTVVLSGGSLQNRILERGLVERLGAGRVSMAREVPVNDGGIALGQAWNAVLALASEST